MKFALRLLPMFVLVAAVAAAASWYTARCCMRQRTLMEHQEAHQWVHSQLGLSAAQLRDLAPMETKFHEEKERLEAALRLANRELGRAILENRGESPRVADAVQRIHHAQGDLQNATLRHIFEMRQLLTPAQYDQLLRLTAGALNAPEPEQ